MKPGSYSFPKTSCQAVTFIYHRITARIFMKSTKSITEFVCFVIWTINWMIILSKQLTEWIEVVLKINYWDPYLSKEEKTYWVPKISLINIQNRKDITIYSTVLSKPRNPYSKIWHYTSMLYPKITITIKNIESLSFKVQSVNLLLQSSNPRFLGYPT